MKRREKATYTQKIDCADSRGSFLLGFVGVCIDNGSIRLDGTLMLVVGFETIRILVIPPRPA
jgi:hypothetical protein